MFSYQMPITGESNFFGAECFTTAIYTMFEEIGQKRSRKVKKYEKEGIPGIPVVGMRYSHCWEPGFDPRSWN